MGKKQTMLGNVGRMTEDLTDLQQQLAQLRGRIPTLHAELAKIDSNLPDTIDKDSKLSKADLLTQRAMLQAELDSLPGQAYELRFRLVHVDVLLLRQKRELARLEADQAAGEFQDEDIKLSKAKLEKRHVTNLRRHGHLTLAEANEQTKPLTAELRTLEPTVRQAKAGMIRSQSRARGLTDTCKSRYRVGLDASPEKVDEAADRLAQAEKEAVFLLCYPRWQTKPWQPRP